MISTQDSGLRRLLAGMTASAMPLLITVPLFAQMHGGGGNPAGMMLSMNAGTGSCGMDTAVRQPVAGPDGTAYVLLPVTQAAQAAPAGSLAGTRWRLSAVSGRDGSVRWSLDLDGVPGASPVVGTEGRIYLVLSSGLTGQETGGMMTPTAPAGTPKSQLVIITDSGAAGRISRRVDLDGQVTSAPVISPHTSGGYSLFVTTTLRIAQTGMMGASTTIVAHSLYITDPDGLTTRRLPLLATQP